MRVLLALGFSSVLVLSLSGCGGNVGTSSSSNPDMPSGDDDDDGGTPTPQEDPAQLAITGFEVAVAGGTDPYEPNDLQAFYLGGYGFEYTIDDAVLAPRTLTYTVEVTNTGAPVTAPFNVEFFRDVAALPVGQLGDMRQEIPSLDRDASAEIVFEVPNPTPGSPQAWAVADLSNVIPETDEADNASNPIQTAVSVDVDVYSVFQTAGYPLDIRLDNLSADFDLEILGPGGNVIASSINDGTAAETLNGTVGQDGYYGVRVIGYNGAASAMPYRLRITVP